jgi:hypothetical protein
MNIFGRILLILGALCFLAISIYLIVKTIALSNASTPPDLILTVISWISVAVLLFGGVGGVFLWLWRRFLCFLNAAASHPGFFSLGWNAHLRLYRV